MRDVSKVIESALFPVVLPVHPYLLDHRFEGKVVFPAVEAMQVLAGAVKRFRPSVDVSLITHARFDKFLYIDPGAHHVSASIEMREHENGDITASLLTKSRSNKLAITRSREHATLCFPLDQPSLSEPPADLAFALEGICLEISSEKIYRDLVPFGASFQNVRSPLLVSRDGAIAWTCAPMERSAAVDEASPLGSPFPLDASFHAACVWGQRYAGIAAFPVGIEKRVLLRRTLPGFAYFSRILPVRNEQGLLAFDIWIYDERGDLYEGACGVSMRDVSAGRMRPPQWVIHSNGDPSLERIQCRCLGSSVVELKTIQPLAERALSVHEKNRFQRLGEPRKRSYLAARLACKRLSRTLRGNDLLTPAPDITTLCPDQIRPCCLLVDGDSAPCSVSHDDRFGIAAAGEHRIGVDVERISERVLKSRHLYMDDSEQILTREADLGELETAVRIWTLKEAAAKAFDLTLAESWNRIRVIAVDPFESRFRLEGQETRIAVHAEVAGHLFTLVCE